MKFLPSASLVFFSCLAAATALSQQGKAPDPINADELLRQVRYSYTRYDRDFTGQLRRGLGVRIPFTLSLQPHYVRFKFRDPPQIIHLSTAGNRFFLKEVVAGSDAAVPPERYGERIRDTDLTYDDLSMRFLYWPDARMLKEERIKARKCWLIQVTNPDGKGIYGTVDIWIHQKSGGMMKMVGRDRQGRSIREFEVLHGRKLGDVWIVDEMRFRTLDPRTGKTLSHTYMEILDTAKAVRAKPD